MKNFSDFEAKLRLSGRRLTPLRRELLCVLEDAARPLPAMRLLSLLEKRGRTVNKTTIYRELDLFEDLGMVQAFDLGGRERCYEVSAGERHHHHFVCVACDRVEDVSLDESLLRAQAARAARHRKFRITRHMLEFFGFCRQCLIS